MVGGSSTLGRGLLTFIAVALIVVIGAVWALGLPPVGPSRAGTSYCPLSAGTGMEIPTPGPTHNASPNASQFYANGSVLFWGGATGCQPPYTFTWTFGDGSPNVVVSGWYDSVHPYEFLHVYPGSGYFAGDLAIADSAGHSSVSYFCIDASAWPMLTGASGNPAPHCGP